MEFDEYVRTGAYRYMPFLAFCTAKVIEDEQRKRGR